MVKLCFTYRAEPNRTIETRRGISLDLQTEDVYTELGTDPRKRILRSDRRHRRRLAQRRTLLRRGHRDLIAGHARKERHAALHQRGQSLILCKHPQSVDRD